MAGRRGRCGRQMLPAAQALRERELVAEFARQIGEQEAVIRQLQSTLLGRLGVYYARLRDRMRTVFRGRAQGPVRP